MCGKDALSRHKKVCVIDWIQEEDLIGVKPTDYWVSLITSDCGVVHASFCREDWDRTELAMNGTYLHMLPRDSVYSVLIDSFRLRETDTAVMGEYEEGRPFDKFQAYLTLMASREGMAPTW